MEVVPLAKLIGVFVAMALVPFTVVFLLSGHSVIGVLFTLVGQFILAVGSGIVLMYIIARALQLSGE
ncbi:hypothetical protein [Haladaptatus sp. DFWS20]|uniref:hypothetical protein n=1 Tax=Haladaptatus sp. DFWS20 TaxID=3403467 RepID=UPI003EBCF4A8